MNRSDFQFPMTKIQRNPKLQTPRPRRVTNVESLIQFGSRHSHWTLELGVSLEIGLLDLVISSRRFVDWSPELLP